MIEEIKNIKSGKRELRQFGVTIGIVLGFLGALLLFRQKDYYFYFFTFSGVFFLFGLMAPILLKPIQKIWMTLAILMGWVVTRVILIILFYLVVTPLGLVAKLFGKAFLDLKFDRAVNSYWILREAVKIDKRSYENQF